MTKRLPYKSGLSCGILQPGRVRELFVREIKLLSLLAAKRIKKIADREDSLAVIFEKNFALKHFFSALTLAEIDFMPVRLSGAVKLGKKSPSCFVIFVPVVSQISAVNRICRLIKGSLKVRKIYLAALLFEGMPSRKC